jgi:hypothetical protein
MTNRETREWHHEHCDSVLTPSDVVAGITGKPCNCAPPESPSAEQIAALLAAGRDPAPYVHTYTTGSESPSAPLPEPRVEEALSILRGVVSNRTYSDSVTWRAICIAVAEIDRLRAALSPAPEQAG